jgi:hypothetical protein
MDKVCSTYGKYEKCMQKVSDHLETLAQADDIKMNRKINIRV